jgi:hypothetical protein
MREASTSKLAVVEARAVEAVLTLGAGMYLRKPNTIARIAQTVREELDRQ